ncbi:serine hydrolase domain-containing protein [Kosmotoga arenicorallina]|uniref:serine hydrolase domain-containing protein n=1 Tax=Kosmotoga arenicorallina TaxID=688066 RepID=UPI001F25ABD7|nr:serine hydrolase domain-containing protein [Kosmotoga arenicorallina]
MKEGIENGVYPGAVVLIGTRDEILFLKAFGKESPERHAKAVSIDTVYDLASLTKVVAVLPAVMLLMSQGKLSLGDPVYLYLNEFSNRKQITIFHLVTHSSGMPPYSTAWKKLSGEALLKHLLFTNPELKPGKAFQYSCINFIILKAIIERISGIPFEVFVNDRIFLPLGMNSTGFLPDINTLFVAPTCKREGEFLKGKPDDELAYYLGGVSGNAGCFSSAEDLYRLLKGLEEGLLFPRSIYELFTREIVEFGGIKTHLGWRMPDFSGSSGDTIDRSAYGHTGFTGTSIWVDPKSSLRVIFLSNRTRLRRRSTIPMMQSIRRRLHNTVFQY